MIGIRLTKLSPLWWKGISSLTDKQQELDLPTVKVDEPQNKKKEEEQNRKSPMTQITGVRKMKHANSFTGIIPKYGVEPTNADLLSQVNGLKVSVFLSTIEGTALNFSLM